MRRSAPSSSGASASASCIRWSRSATRTWSAATDYVEVTMKSWMKSVLAAAALASCAAPAFAQGDEASVEKRLADAQRRLEAAAREVAELSGEAAGPGGPRQFEYFVGGPRRAM